MILFYLKMMVIARSYEALIEHRHRTRHWHTYW